MGASKVCIVCSGSKKESLRNKMAKSNYKSRDYYNRESEGLRQRRLKEESRWRFNPNQEPKTEDDLYEDDFEDLEY
jgi:hypothetical protein